ncbi:MAG TPA: mechanosensitive ion channel domain-containing protein [Dongiaceae bacterium]|nr:mechanosensitive ion channel domain-containing protein [Dongiaceae bacterium]
MNALFRPVFWALIWSVLVVLAPSALAAGEKEKKAEVSAGVGLEDQLKVLQEEQKLLARQNADINSQMQQAPTLVAQMRQEISRLERQSSTSPKIPKTTEALESSIELLDAQVKSIQLSLSDVMDRISEQQALPTQASEQVGAAQRQIQELENQLRSALQADQTVPGNNLQAQVLRQQLANANLRRDIAGNGLDGYQKLLEMHTVNRDLLLLRLSALKTALDLLRTERDSLREKNSETQQEDNEQLQSEWEQKPKPIVTQLEENQRLATLLSTVSSSLVRTNDAIADGKQELQDLRYRFDIAEQQLQLTDFHQYVDDYLLRQRQSLQVRIWEQQDSSDLTGQISQARLDQFKFDDQLHQVRTGAARQRKIDSVLKKIPDLDETSRSQVAAEVQEILSQREEVLSRLLEVNAKLVVSLTNLQLLQQDQLTQRQQFFELLNEKLLWRRSGTPLNLEWLKKLPGSVQWFFTNSGWLELLQLWYQTIVKPVFPLLGLLIVAALFYWPRQRFVHQLEQLRDDIGNVMKDQFRHTVMALAITVYLAIPVPVLIMLLAYPLTSNTGVSLFVSSVGEGLFAAARWILLVEFVRNLCRDTGLARVHFSWRPSAVAALQRWLPKLYWQVPFAFIFIVVWGDGDEDHPGLLGRAAYFLMAILFWYFMLRLMSPKVGLIQRDEQGEQYWYQIWGRQVFWVAMLIPITLILLALQGFNFSAFILYTCLYQTFMLGFMIFILDQVLTRWFAVQERKIALDRALAKREAARKVREQQEAAKATGESVPELELQLPTIDVATISEQNRALLRVMSWSLFFVAAYWVWQDLFKATEFFNEIVLWTYTLDNTPGAARIPVTLGSLLLTLVAVLLTYVGVKNLPGLIEVMVLQRFRVDTGLRFTITTLARYLVFIFGTLYVSEKIGLDWSKLGWLVAALGVGLGFGLQEIFANFVSGLIILFERPIRIGDTVTIGTLSGTVSRIRMRATTIVDADRKELIIPNRTFVTSQFVNWTLSDTILRLVVPVSVVSEADIKQVTETLLAIAQENENVLRDPAPSAALLGFGSGSQNFELRVFSPMSLRGMLAHDLNTEIKRRFAELGIAMPSGSLDVHVTRVEESPAAVPATSS